MSLFDQSLCHDFDLSLRFSQSLIHRHIQQTGHPDEDSIENTVDEPLVEEPASYAKEDATNRFGGMKGEHCLPVAILAAVAFNGDNRGARQRAY